MEMSEFWTICSSNGIILSLEQLKQIERFAGEIVYWNEQVNMISRKDMEHLYERHILHSLTILKYIDLPQRAKCLDIGTGGGFPGTLLAIACPTIRMTLTDSINKKLKIASMLASHTGIKGLNAKCIRVEELADDKNNIRSFDFIFARAVARIGILVGWTEALLKPKGKFVFLKGGDLTDEIAEARERFPYLEFQEIDMNIFGAEWFKNENKKLVIVNHLSNKSQA